jgi:hypothetical protein
MSDPTPNPTPADPATPEPPKAPEGKTFTQADLDRIVEDRLARERAKFADYDDLKAKAGQSQTLEERVAAIEKEAKESEARALRAEVANAKGLTPGQAKRLVGSTKDELEADADALLADIGAQRKQGNVAPKEGGNPNPSGAGGDLREFTRNLFKSAAAD